MANEPSPRNDIPTNDSGARPGQHTYVSDDDDWESESDGESIFALRVPPTMQVSPAQYQHGVSNPRDSASNTAPKTLPTTVLAVVGAVEPPEPSLIDTFLASAAPQTPQLVSVLISLTEKLDDRIKSDLQSLGEFLQGMRQCPAGQQQSGFGSSASGFNANAWSHARNPSGYGTSRQQPTGGGDENDSEADDDDDDDDEDPNNLKESVSDLGDSSEGEPLACVFFRRYPNSKNLARSCLGPGWKSPHRLKEHIYRVHLLNGFACARCEEVFETKQHLDRHLRRTNPCKLSTSPEEEVLFINHDQEKQLRKRHRNGNSRERWVRIFQVVFPDVPEDDIPSPYHEIVTSLPPCDLKTLQDFKAYAREEIPRRIFRVQGVDETGAIARAVFGPCRQAIDDVFSEFISGLQFTSAIPGANRNLELTPAVDTQPRWSDELLSPGGNMSISQDLSPGPSFLASPLSSARPTSFTVGGGDLVQSSYDYEHHRYTCNDPQCRLQSPYHALPQPGSSSFQFSGGGY